MSKTTAKDAEPVASATEPKVAAAAATAPESLTPLSTEEEIVQLPCARKYFFKYADTAWGHCLNHLNKFARKSARFTVTFIDGQIQLVNTVKELPDYEILVAVATQANVSLIANRQQVMLMAQELGIAIGYAFKDALVAEAEKTQAGLTAFTGASPTDWGAASTFMEAGNKYLRLKAETLVTAGAIVAAFPDDFKAVGTAFEAAWSDFVAKRKAANLATKAVKDGLKQILVELNPMMALGRSIYKFDATNRKLFTISRVVAEVRGTTPGGVKGLVKMNAKPRADVRVEIVGMEDKFALTNKKGRYEIGIAAGTYDVRFTADDTQPLTIANRKVEAGVRGFLNVELQPMPVETLHATPPPATSPAETSPAATTVPETPLSSPKDMDNQFNNAMSEVMEKPKANGTAKAA